MHVSSHWADATLTLRLVPESGEPRGTTRASLAGRVARFTLPVAVDATRVHPDVEALLALLIIMPFADSFSMDRPVSPLFARAVEDRLERRISPVDPTLAPRRPPPGGAIGLAFSGGADSSAALALLPDSTVLSFLRRVPPPQGAEPTAYSDTAAMWACQELERRGRTVRVVESDVVRLRHPVGFTTDWINAAGLLLLADVDRLDGLSWGLIAESAYRTGHEAYEDWAVRQALRWGPLFAAVGLPMCQVTAGVSEVGTATIVRRAPHGDLAQSCQLGRPGVSCRRCWKCFRKRIVDSAISGSWPGDAELDGMLRSPAVRHKLVDYPIKHENVVAWAMQHYPGRHPVMLRLAERTHAAELDLGWLTRYYPPSIDILPETRRADAVACLDEYLEPMTPEDEARMRGWDMHPILADPRTEAARAALVRALGPEWSPLHGGLGRLVRGLGRRARRASGHLGLAQSSRNRR